MFTSRRTTRDLSDREVRKGGDTFGNESSRYVREFAMATEESRSYTDCCLRPSVDGDCDWESLPEEILLLVLTKLPLRIVLRSRAVCKSWNSAIQASRLPPFPPCCVLYSEQQVLVFDIGERKWHDWEQFSSVPRSLLAPSTYSHRPPFTITAAGGPFLVLESKMHSYHTVLNPVNMSYKHFPRAPKGSEPRDKLEYPLYYNISALKMDNASHTWKLFDQRRVQRGSMYTSDTVGEFSVFNSRDHSWDVPHEFNPTLSISNSGEPVQVTTGFVYYLAKTRIHDHENRDRVGQIQVQVQYDLCGYDLERRQGQVLHKLTMLDSIGFAYLFESQGRLALLGTKAKAVPRLRGDSPLTAVYVWQLDEARMEWIEVSRMPAELQAKFYFEVGVRNLFRLSFTSSGEYVGMVDLRSKQLLVLFNIVTKSWTWSDIPPPPKPVDDPGMDASALYLRDHCGVHKFLMFQPTIHASA